MNRQRRTSLMETSVNGARKEQLKEIEDAISEAEVSSMQLLSYLQAFKETVQTTEDQNHEGLGEGPIALYMAFITKVSGVFTLFEAEKQWVSERRDAVQGDVKQEEERILDGYEAVLMSRYNEMGTTFANYLVDYFILMPWSESLHSFLMRADSDFQWMPDVMRGVFTQLMTRHYNPRLTELSFTDTSVFANVCRSSYLFRRFIRHYAYLEISLSYAPDVVEVSLRKFILKANTVFLALAIEQLNSKPHRMMFQTIKLEVSRLMENLDAGSLMLTSEFIEKLKAFLGRWEIMDEEALHRIFCEVQVRSPSPEMGSPFESSALSISPVGSSLERTKRTMESRASTGRINAATPPVSLLSSSLSPTNGFNPGRGRMSSFTRAPDPTMRFREPTHDYDGTLSRSLPAGGMFLPDGRAPRRSSADSPSTNSTTATSEAIDIPGARRGSFGFD